MANMEGKAPPWTWRRWIVAKAEMEEACARQVREARQRASDADDRARRAQEELSRCGWYDKHHDMLERVAEDAARSIVEDVLEAIRERLSSSD